MSTTMMKCTNAFMKKIICNKCGTCGKRFKIEIKCPDCGVTYKVLKTEPKPVTCMDCGAIYMQQIHNTANPEYIRAASYRCKGDKK